MDSEQSTVEQDPFGTDSDGRFTYLNANSEELLSTLLSAINEGRTRLLIVGGEGSGKSSFLRKLAEVLYTSCDVALLGHELVFPCRHDTSLEAIEAAVFVTATVCEGGNQRPDAAVLLLDDADRLDPAVLDSLWHRWPVLNQTWPSISVVMTALPEPKRLHGPSAHDAMAAELTFDLPPLALADVEGLIKHRLHAAGLTNLELFTPDALTRIAYFSKRVPARIVQLCQYILDKVGHGVSIPVTEDVVKDAAYELFLPDHLQKLARGLGCQSKPLWGRLGPQEDAAAAIDARRGLKRTDDIARGKGLTQYEAAFADSNRIGMPPVPPGATAAGLLPGTGLPQRRRRHRYLRIGARVVAIAVGVLLVIVAAVVAFAVRQSYQLSGSSVETAVESPAPSATSVRSEQSIDAKEGSANGSAGSLGNQQEVPTALAPPAAPAAGGAPAEVPTDEVERSQAAALIDRADEPAEAPRPAGTDAASPPPPTGEALARVEPRRPPTLVERDNVAFVQSQLNARGYGAGPVDGIMGPRTRSAIQRFQADTGLPVDGSMNDSLIASLRRQPPKSNLQMPGRERPRRRLLPALRGQLDSVKAPQEFQDYCRNNPDTWLFDKGTDKWVFCGHVVKQR